MTRVYLNHFVPYVDLVDDYITLAQRGCYMGFDMTGIEVVVYFERELKLAETLKALIDAGYLEQILISQDVCFSACYVKNGGYGYAHILNDIVPLIKAKGIRMNRYTPSWLRIQNRFFLSKAMLMLFIVTMRPLLR